MENQKEQSIKNATPWITEKLNYFYLHGSSQKNFTGRLKMLEDWLEGAAMPRGAPAGKTMLEAGLGIPIGLKGQKILDVGCGLGDWASLIARKMEGQGYVAGIAPTDYFISASRETAQKLGVQVDFRIGTMEKMDFTDQSFDLITCLGVMLCVKDHIKTAGLKEMFRLLKPGGKVIIQDLAQPPLTWQWPFNLLFYRLTYGYFCKMFWRGQFPGMMKDAGFINLYQTPPVSSNLMFIYRWWVTWYTAIKPESVES